MPRDDAPVDGATRPVARRPRRGRPPKVTRDQVVATAIELGLDAFTMQGLAERLGVSTPALYTHVAGREEVLGLVNAALLERMTAFASPVRHWRDWLVDFAHEVRTHLAPSASALMDDLRGPATTVRLGVGEQGLQLLLDAGFPPAEAGRAVWLVFRTALTCGPPRSAAALAGFVDDTGAVLAPSVAADLPATRAVQAALAGEGPVDTFDHDLDVVLAGIARRVGHPAQPSSPASPSPPSPPARPPA